VAASDTAAGQLVPVQVNYSHIGTARLGSLVNILDVTDIQPDEDTNSLNFQKCECFG
jgi:hypothetical protein